MNSTTKTNTSHALRLLDEMDGYFTSMNSVQPLPAERKSVPVGEWTELRDAVRAELASASSDPCAAARRAIVRVAAAMVPSNEEGPT